jgi:hypothetical protein
MSVSPITTYLDVLSISFTFTTLFFGSDAAANPGRHDISEILLKVALKTIKQTNKQTNKQI